jgi:threonine synthase
MAAESTVKPDDLVVCLLTGSGLKDIATARKVAGEPTSIDADTTKAKEPLDALGL